MFFHLTTVYLLVFDLVLVGFLIEVLRRAGASRKLVLGVGIGAVAWIALLAYLLPNQLLYPSNVTPTAFFVSILASVFALTAIGLFTPIGRLLGKSPQELLMLPQGLRVFFGAGFLMQGVLGLMPASFAIADGITHITAAFLCMKAAVLLRNPNARRGELWFANLFGLIDIVVVACGLSFFLLADIGPHHNVMLAALFAAPVFINLHLVSIWKLIVERQVASQAEGSQRIEPVA